MLKNGNLQLGNGQEVPIPQVCAPTVVKSDGSKVYLFADANIKTLGSQWEVLLNIDLLLRALL